MPDDPPISTTVSEAPVTVDTGVDKETVQTLNSAFDDFWTEQDSKIDLEKEPAPKAEAKSPPPPPPDQGAAQETVKEPAGISDPLDIDKMELPPHTRPEHIEQFKKVKDLWKADQRRAEEAAKRAQALEQELAETRKNAWTPETRADYEHAASIRRRFDFISDPDFLQKFQAPVITQFERALDEAVKVLPNRRAAEEWAAEVKRDYRPDQVNRDWWMNDVVAKVPSELDRAALINQVTKLLDLQQERDSEIGRRTNDKSSFDNWMTEKAQTTQARVQEEIMAEIGVQEQRIKQVWPVDVSKAKTSEERQAMEAHNERFEKYNKFFVETVQDCSKNGPRGWVRAAIEATRTQIMNEQIINLEKEVKELKSERDQLSKDLEKVTGARRRIAHTSGAPSTSAAQSKQNGQSFKDQSDPRKALEDYWNEIDRKQ